MPDGTILLIEDSPRDREIIRMAMRKISPRGNILNIDSGEDALSLLKRNDPSMRGSLTLILLDIKLPGMSGIDVLCNLKSDDELKSIPVVMFTSSGEKKDIDRCYSLGANGYVVKPLRFSEYVETLRSINDFWSGINVLPD